jgi:predicted AAA+ superfamily ATPase
VAGIAELVVRGGWPASLDQNIDDARAYVADYLALLADIDVTRFAERRRDPNRIRRLLQAVARNTASEAGIATLAGDVGGSDLTMSRDTTMEYLDALGRLMIVEDQPAWSTHLRSAARLRKAPKRHFVDPSLSAAALGATPAGLMADLNTLGLLFESLVIRDLRIYAQALGAEVYHYRDSNGREADAVIQLPDGGWAAFEIKLGPGAVDAAADSLCRFAQDVDTAKVGEARALVVIVGTGFGYRRADGVNVLSIGALGP